MFPPGPVLSNGSWAFERMCCQGQPPSIGVRTRRAALAALACCAVLRPAQATTTVEVRCSELDRESAAAFEARAHTELLVRGLSGTVRLDCGGPARLTWSPLQGPERGQDVALSSPERLLSTLSELLEWRPPDPAPASAERPQIERTEPVRAKMLDIRAAGAGQLWDGQAALGAEMGVGVPFAPLTIVASGHLTRGALSYGGVSLYVLRTRLAAEVPLLDVLHVSLGAGAGRPFTTETQAVARVDANDNPWFVEGFTRCALPLRASESWRLAVGGELALFSRPLRLQVDATRGYDFGWQPGVFLEAAYAVR